ncbi:antibiotic biosynthesis monooxygenase [Bradyrhizobium sp. U87765 SZCCT0131]|uniref:antibiotic biosynthesis monooxygenase n=1 Tax=unclassified Bradyrhizobium TaxID=2631580 RepID=UPI001BA4630E|nr:MULTISPECIES: antibiotic biosynthesis monooxygenase [unclassified Bradyrhizobium]MBR1221826.1 antibiotic biosynthesis monooxygenase [Bradyrhizobium sp. U87765 SZCCT0131]MBR1263976.1 antibiotic biosynthesis monooxygenase [Bradyrhizobium sp. U87765 SZCCT0134]MBR1308241.1 antibiotic biosynthesis monooxygenase [Bradyrhizobium sp. U87765 SZCCT0110]MBR1320226.1 antibiotic biosynthesis monooxygenase [Bradyrhizobium sp. U87765 SZCCT0109]MBR1348661.1 antibiotic biosynthesis monooxygenase [Bradyrhizo
MAASRDSIDGPVALVIQRRIADEGFAAFARWSGAVAERLKSWPGFLGQEVVPPQPPAHVDWVLILRFASAAAARGWLQSDLREELLAQIRHHFVGPEDIHLLPDAGQRQETAVSAVISFKVPPGADDTFLAWQQRIQAAEAEFKGFLRHKIEPPIPGLHDDWIIILSFDSDAHLSAWLDSPERQALLAEGERFNAGMSVKRTSYGFNFWFPAGQAPAPGPAFIFKCNLLVLLVLYPIVYLWGFFVSRPLIDAHGVPFWLSLFIGNLVSTQLLGWWVVPAAFKAFDWWLKPTATTGRQIGGYALVAALYVVAMAIFALLLAWNWGKG